MKKLSLFIALSGLLWLSGCHSGQASTNSAYGSGNSNSGASNASGAQNAYSSGPLLGKWKDKDINLTMDFKADGTVANIYDGNTTYPKYEYLPNNRVRLTAAYPRVFDFTVQGDQMTMTWEDLASTKNANQYFVRVK